MSLTKEQIRKQPATQSWVSPNYGHGGWAITPGCERYTTEWEPMKDRILVEILPQKQRYASIIRPENAVPDTESRYARVLKVGKGKRETGTGEIRQCCCLRVGDTIIIGQHVDWESQDGRYAICQEEDARVVIREDNGKANGVSA